MYYSKFLLTVFSIAVLITAFRSYSDEDTFIRMVIDNITAAEHYVLPTDNSKLLQSDNEKYDYGTFDFVIVGAGTAGALLANRLSEVKQWSVLVLEAGGEQNVLSDIPGLAPYLQLSDMNWGYFSVPQKTACLGMVNQSCPIPRGKVIGGTSTINGKMYIRGNKEDYNSWEKMGNYGWSYKDVLPYFMKTEDSNIDNGDVGYHGKDGLLHTDYIKPTIFTKVFLDALKERGLPLIDYNGENQIGGSKAVFTINAANSGNVFLTPYNNRKNLNVTLNAFVTHIVTNRTDAVSKVEFVRNNKTYVVNVNKEVILSAGSVNSPQLLMKSGLGPKEELNRIGVQVIQDIPVGKRLQDQPIFFGLLVKTNQTLFSESQETLLKNFLNNDRPYTAGYNIECLSFMNVNDKTSTVPNILTLLGVPPGFGSMTGKILNFNEANLKSFGQYNPNSDLMFAVILIRPKSIGTLSLKSSDMKHFPNIDFNLFSDPENEDIETMRKGIMENLKLLETKAFKAVNATFQPVATGCENFKLFSKNYWHCAIRQLSTSAYKIVGTTRMGVSRKDSVVSPNCLVHGMTNLRVVDAGIMPEIPAAAMMAPTYMIAEKAADEIKRHHNVI